MKGLLTVLLAVCSIVVSAAEVSVPPVSPAARAEAEWTVMYYFAGKSDLEGSFFKSINALEALPQYDGINLLVERGRMSGQPHDSHVDGDWTGARVYHITPDSNSRRINSEVLAEYTEVDQGDWRHLAGFIKKAKTLYPARRYLLFIASHGSGWYYEEDPRARGMAFDEETGGYVDTPQLRRVFEEAGPVSILVNDSCFQQGVEIAYELRDSVEVMLGAEGYSYDQDYAGAAAALASGPYDDSAEVGRRLVSVYDRYNRNNRDPYDFSAVYPGRAVRLAELMDRWSGEVLVAGNREALSEALRRVPRLDYPYYVDLADFVRVYEKAAGQKSQSASTAEELLGYIDGEMTIYRIKRGKIPPLKGISVQLPGSDSPVSIFSAAYSELQISRDFGWDDFMEEADEVLLKGAGWHTR